MQRWIAWAGGMILGIGLLLIPKQAEALFDRPIALQSILASSQYIVTAKIDAFDPAKPSMVLTVDDDLKGKFEIRRIPVNLTGDAEAKKLDHLPQLLKRLAPKLPIILFVSKPDKDYVGFVYTNGTWFQIIGTKADDTVRWGFTHCEPNLRGTFAGTTEELRQLVVDVLADKKKAPPPNPKEKPGFGPEVPPDQKPKEEKEQTGLYKGPVFGVVVPVLVGGPVALLAMLFPAVFGGLTGQLRRWLALLSTASLNSTLYFLYGWGWFYSFLKGTWWGSPLAMWIIISLLTVAGTLWAWRRQTTMLQQEIPQRGEHVTLWVMSLMGGGLLGCLVIMGQSLLASPWKMLLVLWIGIWAGTLYVLYLRMLSRRSTISVEGMVLGAMALACTALMATMPRTTVGAAEVAEGSMHKVTLGTVNLKFEAEDRGNMESSPWVLGERIFVGAALEGNPFSKQRTPGAVYCIARDKGASDKESLRQVWKFDDEQKMTQVFSSPCVAQVRVTPEKDETLLYIGEGFHTNDNCKFYCLKADTGEKVWEFATRSHTESSPCVAGGKVFFGAGDDGLYCVDAAKGTELWHFADKLHVDANPVVAGSRLYCGGGVIGTAEHKRSAIFCLDVESKGNQIWQHETDLPVMCAPTVADKQVFFGIGNGNFSMSDRNPAGAILCVDADTGKTLWRHDVGESVLTKPTVNGHNVYFGARDGNFYCIHRKDGRLLWKRNLGSPVVASPASANCSTCGAITSIYVAATKGQLYCLDPSDGKIQWSFDLGEDAKADVSLYSSPFVVVERIEGKDRRRIYLGADVYNSVSTAATLYCFEDYLED